MQRRIADEIGCSLGEDRQSGRTESFGKQTLSLRRRSIDYSGPFSSLVSRNAAVDGNVNAPIAPLVINLAVHPRMVHIRHQHHL